MFVVNNNKPNKSNLFFLPNCVLHFSRAELRFSNMFVDKLNVFEFEKKLKEFLM